MKTTDTNKVSNTPRTASLCKEREARQKAEAEVERLKAKVAERDQLVRTCNLLAKEEQKIMQRWKDWGITKEQQLKRAVEIAEAYQRGNSGLHYQCNCASCQLLGDLKGEIKIP